MNKELQHFENDIIWLKEHYKNVTEEQEEAFAEKVAFIYHDCKTEDDARKLAVTALGIR